MLVLHAFQMYTSAEIILQDMQYKLCCQKFFCNGICVQVCIDNCGSTQQRYLITGISYKFKIATSNVLTLNLIKP